MYHSIAFAYLNVLFKQFIFPFIIVAENSSLGALEPIQHGAIRK